MELRTIERDQMPDMIKAGMGVIHKMDGTGDTKYIWDPTKSDEVEAAQTMFDDLTAKKYIAWHVDDDGKKTEKMRTFDPKAGRIILTQLPVGG